MTEIELQQYLKTQFPKESSSCEWKEFKNLKHFMKGHEGEDIISYVSTIANMEGGHLVIGVEDKTLVIIGLEDFYNYTPENIVLNFLEQTPILFPKDFMSSHIQRRIPQKLFGIPYSQTSAQKAGIGTQQTLAAC